MKLGGPITLALCGLAALVAVSTDPGRASGATGLKVTSMLDDTTVLTPARFARQRHDRVLRPPDLRGTNSQPGLSKRIRTAASRRCLVSRRLAPARIPPRGHAAHGAVHRARRRLARSAPQLGR